MSRKRRYLGAGVIVGIIAIWAVGKLFFGPAEGTVTTPSAKEQPKVATGTSREYRGEWVSFTYPAGYEKRTPALQPGIKEAVELLAHNPSRQIEVAVYEANLNEDPGVMLRRHAASQYREESVDVSGLSGRSFIRTDGGFQGASYLQHGSLLATVALTSYGADVEGARREFSRVMDSFRWLK